MNAIEMIKMARSLAADLAAVSANNAELRANPLKMGPGVEQIMATRNAIQAKTERIKNLGYLGDVPKPPRRVPGTNWGMMIDPVSFKERVFNGIHEVPNPQAYRLPPFPRTPAGKMAPGVQPIGETAHNFWRNQVTQRPMSEALLGQHIGKFPVMEQALGMAGMTGPNSGMLSRLPAGDSLALSKVIGGWRRSTMRGNPEFRTAFRRLSAANRFPGILRSVVKAI